MRKIISLFQRNYDGDRLVRDEVVTDHPSDQWHVAGFENTPALVDGTYELVGPKIQKNAEGFDTCVLIRHGNQVMSTPREFEGIKSFLDGGEIEGIVWHHPDGRMVKIKARDFGVPR